jgi:hypothetical protein
VTFWTAVRRIVTNGRLVGFVRAVVVLALAAEAAWGDTARQITMWAGVAVGAVVIRRWR